MLLGALHLRADQHEIEDHAEDEQRGELEDRVRRGGRSLGEGGADNEIEKAHERFARGGEKLAADYAIGVLSLRDLRSLPR